MLPLVFGAERFRQYIYGREVDVQSDYKPLNAMMKKNTEKRTSQNTKTVDETSKVPNECAVQAGERHVYYRCMI